MAVRILRIVAWVAILAGLAGSLYFSLPAYRLPPGGSGEIGGIQHLPAAGGVLVAGLALLPLVRWSPAPGYRGASLAWWFSLPTLLTGLGGAVFSGGLLAVMEIELRRNPARRFAGLVLLGDLAGAAMMALLAGSLALTLTGASFFGLSRWLGRPKSTPVV